MQNGPLRWGYLIYLGFYFLPPLLQQQTNGWHWAGILLALVVFLVIFHRIGSAQPDERWWLLAGMMLTASAVTPLNSGSMSMFAYVGFFIGFWCSNRRYVLGMLALLSWQAGLFWWCYPSMWLQGYALVVVLGVSVSGLVEQMRLNHQLQQHRSDEELQQMARQLERERIARDLHDLLGHSLATIAWKAELTEVWLDREQPAAAKAQLTELQQLARQSLQLVRETISGYRQQGLDILVPTLLSQLRSSGWICDVDADLHALAFDSPPNIELIVTELCTNVQKHSNGRELWLSASSDGEQWQLRLQDDGQCQVITPGHGLTGIQERVQLLGGAFCWQLAPTCFTLSWPLRQPGSWQQADLQRPASGSKADFIQVVT
jgi:two-component system sensor histidine kinase DesK